MVASTRENLWTTALMVGADFGRPMAMSTRASGKMTRRMAKDRTPTRTVAPTLENGQKT